MPAPSGHRASKNRNRWQSESAVPDEPNAEMREYSPVQIGQRVTITDAPGRAGNDVTDERESKADHA